MLKITDLHASYGTIEALKGVNLEVGDGITCLIGANGAGKSTLLKTISGMVDTVRGSILLDGRELLGRSSRKIAQAGITHVPEGRLVFPGLTVYQNLEIGAIPWHGFFGGKTYKKEIDAVFSLFPRLQERQDQGAWSLSGGEQQMLAIGRGLMARPKLLMLDEPSMGLAPLVIDELFRKIVEINRSGIPILLVEQNAELALSISSYAYILEQGAIRLEGEAQKLANDPRILKAYLGDFAKRNEGGPT